MQVRSHKCLRDTGRFFKVVEEHTKCVATMTNWGSQQCFSLLAACVWFKELNDMRHDTSCPSNEATGSLYRVLECQPALMTCNNVDTLITFLSGSS